MSGDFCVCDSTFYNLPTLFCLSHTQTGDLSSDSLFSRGQVLLISSNDNYPFFACLCSSVVIHEGRNEKEGRTRQDTTPQEISLLSNVSSPLFCLFTGKVREPDQGRKVRERRNNEARRRTRNKTSNPEKRMACVPLTQDHHNS